MVSTQIITPATFSPWVEQERNRYTNPRLIDGAGLTGAGALLTPILDGGLAVTATTAGSGASIRAQTPVASLLPVTPGETVEFSADSWSPDGKNAALWILLYNGTSYTGSFVTSASFGGGAAPAREAVSVAIPASGVTHVAFRLAAGSAAQVPGNVVMFDRLRFGAPGGFYIDGNAASAQTMRSSWLGPVNASISTLEVRAQLSPDVIGQVYEEITLTSPDDEITFYATPDLGGFVYDNETLQRWYAPAPIEGKADKRPNAHGAYNPGQIFTNAHRPLISGQYYGKDSLDAKAQRARLVAMFNDGNSITMSVKDEAGVTTSREVWLVDYDAPFKADFSHFTFDVELLAPDALRYGEMISDSTGMPTQSSGLVWNLGTAPSTLYFDWGTVGEDGQVALANLGGAASAPIIEVGGGGAIATGFRITELETGRELIYTQSTRLGDVVTFDSQNERATLNGGGDVTGLMTSRDWFEIPRGATRRYQINPLGSVTGAPTMTGYAASAWL